LNRTPLSSLIPHRKLPDFEDVLKRTIELINPGGWLLLEEADNTLRDSSDLELGPAKKWFNLWRDALKSRRLDINAILNYERILTNSGEFSEVTVHKITVPVSGKSDG
jgi:hypothetical protein